jgi:hypothetical protein
MTAIPAANGGSSAVETPATTHSGADVPRLAIVEEPSTAHAATSAERKQYLSLFTAGLHDTRYGAITDRGCGTYMSGSAYDRNDDVGTPLEGS